MNSLACGGAHCTTAHSKTDGVREITRGAEIFDQGWSRPGRSGVVSDLPELIASPAIHVAVQDCAGIEAVRSNTDRRSAGAEVQNRSGLRANKNSIGRITSGRGSTADSE